MSGLISSVSLYSATKVMGASSLGVVVQLLMGSPLAQVSLGGDGKRTVVKEVSVLFGPLKTGSEQS